MNGKKGKKIGSSVLGKKPSTHIRPPTLEELEEAKEHLREQREEERARKLEQKEEKKLPGSVPSETEPEHKPELIGLKQIDEALKKEGIDVEVKELPDKRLKRKKKTRIDVKEIEG